MGRKEKRAAARNKGNGFTNRYVEHIARKEWNDLNGRVEDQAYQRFNQNLGTCTKLVLVSIVTAMDKLGYWKPHSPRYKTLMDTWRDEFSALISDSNNKDALLATVEKAEEISQCNLDVEFDLEGRSEQE